MPSDSHRPRTSRSILPALDAAVMNRRHLAATVITLLAAPLAGCTMSQVDPDADVAISGRVMQADGTALPNARVALLREPDPGELIGAATVVATLGLVCLTDQPPPICTGLRSTDSDRDGRYTFRLKGRDTRGSIGNASNMHLSVRGPATAGEVEGPASTEIFRVQTEELEILPLRLWSPRLTLSTSAGSIAAAMDPFPAAGYGELETIEASFETGRGPVWQQEDFLGPGAVLDTRLLEDVSGTLVVTARAHDVASGTTVDFRFRTDRIPYAAAAGAPPSRGAAVFGHGPGGPTPLPSGALTDGDLWAAFAPLPEPSCSPDARGQGCEEARANNWIYVDLGTERPVSLIVVRGACWSCAVDVSSDASTWIVVGPARTGTHFVSVPASTPSARYVRVRGATSHDRVLGLTEVSVW